jgi:hypothetical protein
MDNTTLYNHNAESYLVPSQEDSYVVHIIANSINALHLYEGF